MNETGSDEAERLVELGNELLNEDRPADAEGAYRAAADADPTWSVPWYNLGLIRKYQRRWRESLGFNQRAAELNADNQATWWNLGIAATALGEWAEARRAWEACGITLPPGVGAPDGDFGPVPVRLDPADRGEVVWARRIDPARARIDNVPLPVSSFRWRDVVLHDGAPEGFRMLQGKQVPVFNVLARLEPSPFATYVAELGSTDAGVIEELCKIAHQLGGAAEDWGSSTFILCRACSFGEGFEHNHEPGEPAHPHCGIAARDERHVQQILDHWLGNTKGADLLRCTPSVANDQD